MQNTRWKFFTVRTSNQDALRLQESLQDPEIRPGLFEGDIAVTSEVHVGLYLCHIFYNECHVIFP